MCRALLDFPKRFEEVPFYHNLFHTGDFLVPGVNFMQIGGCAEKSLGAISRTVEGIVKPDQQDIDFAVIYSITMLSNKCLLIRLLQKTFCETRLWPQQITIYKSFEHVSFNMFYNKFQSITKQSVAINLAFFFESDFFPKTVVVVNKKTLGICEKLHQFDHSERSFMRILLQNSQFSSFDQHAIIYQL